MTVSSAPAAVAPQISFNGQVVPRFILSSGGAGSAGGGSGSQLGGFGHREQLALVPVAAMLFYGMIADESSLAPDLRYSRDGGEDALTYGGRAEYAGEGWGSYVSVLSGSGDAVYETGGRYDGGWWQASYQTRETKVSGDYELGLSAEWTSGLWEVRPHADAGFAYEDDLSWRSWSSLRLDAAWRSHGWTVRPRASLGLSSNASFASPRLRLDIERKF